MDRFEKQMKEELDYLSHCALAMPIIRPSEEIRMNA
uniref:Peptide deformylase n=1 Tax=Heterorhabditis bacteriophora TaxID=37862 RepID=A0A1I7WZC9_HETBA